MSWLGNRLASARDSAVEDLIKWGVVALGVVVVSFAGAVIGYLGDNLAWGLVGGFGVAVIFLLWQVLSLRAAVRAVGSDLPEIRRDLRELRKEMAIAGYFAELFVGSLDTIQKVHCGVYATTEERLVEHGILEPARELLSRSVGEVRLAVLVPNGAIWKMLYAAGHSLEGKQRFDLPIADSLARIAHETGETQYFPNVLDHPRFKPHPRATREYRSMVSVAIEQGETIIGVLNAIGVDEDAFSDVDQFVVELLGAVIEVALAVAPPRANNDSTASPEAPPGGQVLSVHDPGTEGADR